MYFYRLPPTLFYFTFSEDSNNPKATEKTYNSAIGVMTNEGSYIWKTGSGVGFSFGFGFLGVFYS